MADIDFLYQDGFDTDKAAAEAGDGDFKPIPKGRYRCSVRSVDVQETKKGDGMMFNVRLDVEGPEHAGRVVFDRQLVKHSSEVAENIGRQRFAQLCNAAGLSNPKDTDLLVGKVVEALVKIESDKEYGDKNVVSFYSSVQAKPAAGAVSQGLSVNSNDDDLPF